MDVGADRRATQDRQTERKTGLAERETDRNSSQRDGQDWQWPYA